MPDIFTFRQFQLYAAYRFNVFPNSFREIWSGSRLLGHTEPQDFTRFFFHGAAVARGAHPKSCLKRLI